MKICVVGAGAAGLMAAVSALRASGEALVCVVEKNPILGKKVLISGGGRCNVTTGLHNLGQVLENYPRGKKFLTSAMTQFSPKDVYNWFEKEGVKLKTEEDLRVFPKSNKGRDVVEVFEKIFRSFGERAEILKMHNLGKIEKNDGKFVCKIQTNSKKIIERSFDKVIIATGGEAYRHTGSTGDGYSFAKELGHSITKLSPSLNSFVCKEEWVKKIPGIALKDAQIFAKSKLMKKEQSFRGPFLFTHKGISGPAVFALSSIIAHEEYNEREPLKVRIDFLPGTNQERLRESINLYKEKNPKKNYFHCINQFLHLKSLSDFLLERAEIDGRKNNAEINKKAINKTIEVLKNLNFEVIGRGAGDEFVTAGGVKLKEVNSSDMQSKLCKGLYLAGEILDIDGFTGGFNLQAAWCTGKLAGEKAALEV